MSLNSVTTNTINTSIQSAIGKNTTTTALGSGATFTGAWEQNDRPDVMVSCQTDNTGTLYFDFSVNGSDVNTFPVSGFAVASGIHEFHTAVKGARYFRVRLVNDADAQTYLRLYTYYGQFRQGNAPLNQSIGSDSDATTVKAVGVGADPSGSYVNSKQDGSAFRTTTNLAGSTLSAGIASSNGVSIPLNAHTALFPPSGYIYIGSEFIAYNNYNMIGVITGGSGYTNGTYTNVSTTNGTGSGMTLDITVSGGAVTAATVNTFGGGYADSDSVVPDSITLGGGVGAIIALVNDTSGMTATERGAFGTTASAHSISDIVGEAYDSGILTLDGYTEVATKVLCSNTGQQRFQWYSDSAGTDPIRTIAPSYPPSGGSVGTYDYLAAPNFGPYVRYVFANTQSSATTDFFFETEFYTKSVSAQVLTVNSTILGAMTSNLNRSIISGQNKAGNFKNAPVDSEGHIMVNVHDPRSAFGQLKTAEETTLIQISFPYYISDLKVEQYNLRTDVSTSAVSGTNATVSYESSGGFVSKVLPYDRGSGYTIGDVLTILDGVDNDCTINVSVVDSFGAILALDQDSITQINNGKTDPNNKIQQTNNMLNIQTEAVANRMAIVRTKNRAKYQTGTGIVSRFTAVYDTGTANSNQYVGIGDDNNGFFVGYQGTAFGLQVRREGAETTWVPITSFNVDVLDGSESNSNPSAININPQNGNVFQIKYQWLGFGAITFSVEDPESGDFEPFHIIKYAGSATVPSIFLPTLPLSWEIENTSNTTAIDLFSASGMVALEGKINYQGSKFSASNSGNVNYLFSIRNKRVFKDKVNIIEGILRNISIVNDANSAANYKVYLNPTLSVPAFGDVDFTNSCFEVDTAGAYSFGGTVIANYALAKDSNLNLDIKNGDIKLEPGDILTIVSDNSTTQAAAVNWIEYE